MKLTVVGSGDAFGSGGRLQTCFHIRSETRSVLVDCGGTALIGMARVGLDPTAIDTVLITHLHGDHYTGLVYLLLHARHIGKRTAPLEIIGPPGIEDRVFKTFELMFPGSSAKGNRFDLSFRTFGLDAPMTSGDLGLEVFEAAHPSGSLSGSLRLTLDRRTLAFSGDTEWVDDLLACSADADLFVAECYAERPGVRYHLDWETLMSRIDAITAQRLLLTHMNAGMLEASAGLAHPRVTFATDGMTIVL
ncbi:MAG: MBL fold metallo-hydrolase [Pseudomonadota bacterium]